MSKVTDFSLRVESRHPKKLNAYDATNHRYRESYFHPTQWHLGLTFEVAKRLKRLKHNLDALQNASHVGPRDLDVDEAEEQQLSDDIEALETSIANSDFWFRIEKLGLTFIHPPAPPTQVISSSQETPKNSLEVSAVLTAQGRYRVTAFARKKGQSQIEEEIRLFTLRDILVCTLGDSYACGEGHPEVPLVPDDLIREHANMGASATLSQIQDDFELTPEIELAQWQEPLAHRSYHAGHSIASESVSGRYADVQVVATHASFARSGANIERGLLKPNLHPQPFRRNRRLGRGSIGDNIIIVETDEIGYLDDALKLGQIDEMEATVGNRQIDFLVITIGGNDCGWIKGFVDIIAFDDDLDAQDVKKRVERYIDLHLETELLALNERISKMAVQPRFVLLTLYPLGFFGAGTETNPTTKRNCGIFDAIDLNPFSDADSQIGIDDEEAGIIKELAARLNAMLAEFVVNQNKRNRLINQLSPVNQRHFEWHVVDKIDRDFEIHGYCADNSWFISASDSYLHQGDWGGILHPNAAGQDAYARRIREVMHRLIERNLDSFRPRETSLPQDVVVGPGLGLDPQLGSQ